VTGKVVYRLWLGLLIALMALGFSAWIYQLVHGLTVTGLNNVVSWGLYITAFMYFVGLSAGGLIVVAGAQLAGLHQFRQLSRLAVILSAASITVAASFVLPDLGHPERAYRILISGQLYSPLVWDVVVITTYLTIACIDLWLLSRPHESDRALTVMALVSLPVAVLVHSITAWVFGLLVSRPFWNTPLLAPLFISSALVSGLALLIVVATVLNRLRLIRVDGEILRSLAKLAAVFISIDLFFLFAEVLTAVASNVPDHKDQTMLLLNGKFAKYFWPEVILGGVVPFFVMAIPRTRNNGTLVSIAAVLALGGIALKRLNILAASITLPLIQFPPGQTGGREVAPGATFWFRTGDYFPTWVEWSIAAGIVALGAFLVTMGVRYLVERPAPEVSTLPAGQPAGGR